jgi:2-polyprenyl-3-methyl-5-hydroxy-6-metoxy-1,4-benzoquinol methylase
MSKTQNIYDEPQFFARYWKMKISKPGQSGVPDLDTLDDLLPSVDGKTVLDIGCGDGWFCRWARLHGAKSTHGIDVSRAMLAKAEESSFDENMKFSISDLNDPDATLPGQHYDFVFSALTLHYLIDISRTLALISKSLNVGGHVFFSMEHPMWTASRSRDIGENEQGSVFWPMADYADEGERVQNWLSEGVVKQHRTMESLMTAIIKNNFEIIMFREWGLRTEEQCLANGKRWYVTEDVMPCYLMFGLRRKD